MKILLIHADHFEYEVKQKAIKEPEELTEANKKDSMDEAVVAFCTVEKVDERNLDMVAQRASDSIEEVASWVKTKNVVIYPYAHLSPELGSSNAAISVLKKMEDTLKKEGYKVKRSPFGWYKSFNIKCKGHPLSELSRSITPEEVKTVVKPEEKPSEFIVLEPEGEEHSLDLSDVDACKVLQKSPLLKQFIISEEVGKVSHEPPAHINLMRKLELVDYEPASDIGHFRYYPKGALIKSSLEEMATNIAIKDLHCMRIETPSIYRMDQSDIAGQVARFVEKDYRFKVDEKEFTLRFAGDFGLFRMMKDVTMSYRQLPVRIYELSPSYRLEQSGECVGLRRLRAFTMPDVHCFCKDLQQGMDEYKELFKYYTKLANSMEIDYVVAFRVVKEFYEKHKKWFVELLKIVEKPALLELLPEMRHYWIVKHEYQMIDAAGGNGQLCTVQLDIEDSERYGIFFVDTDGKKKGCIIVHSSMGSIERWIYAILEQAAKMMKQEKPPMLPVWLSPIQVRVVPVSEVHLDYALKVADELEQADVRVDVDDREITLARKIREAETEWIPYIAVVGEKELKEKSLTVRIRGGGQKKMVVTELITELNQVIQGKPRLPLNLPRQLSVRPTFLG